MAHHLTDTGGAAPCGGLIASRRLVTRTLDLTIESGVAVG